MTRPRGHFQRGVEAEKMWMKFEDCAKPTLGERGARSLFDTIQNLERLGSVADFGIFPQAAARGERGMSDDLNASVWSSGPNPD